MTRKSLGQNCVASDLVGRAETHVSALWQCLAIQCGRLEVWQHSSPERPSQLRFFFFAVLAVRRVTVGPYVSI